AQCPDMKVLGEAASPDDVLDQLQPREVDVILLDAWLGGPKTRGLIREVRRRCARCRVLVERARARSGCLAATGDGRRRIPRQGQPRDHRADHPVRDRAPPRAPRNHWAAAASEKSDRSLRRTLTQPVGLLPTRPRCESRLGSSPPPYIDARGRRSVPATWRTSIAAPALPSTGSVPARSSP